MDDMEKISAAMRDPEKAARFWACMDHGPAWIGDWIERNIGLSSDDAMEIAIEAVSRRAADDDRLETERFNRAVIAEHDLTASNWR